MGFHRVAVGHGKGAWASGVPSYQEVVAMASGGCWKGMEGVCVRRLGLQARVFGSMGWLHACWGSQFLTPVVKARTGGVWGGVGPWQHHARLNAGLEGEARWGYGRGVHPRIGAQQLGARTTRAYSGP